MSSEQQDKHLERGRIVAEKLRDEAIPSEGYQQRGRRAWDEGVAVALAEQFREVEQQERLECM